MNKEIKSKRKSLLSLLVATFIVFSTFLAPVHAQCENTVPNPLDPNCAGVNITVGGLANRFIGIIPLVITVLAVAAIGRGAVKIIWASDAEGRQAGFKGIINAIIGAAVFYSIWLILFLIEYFTGAELIPFIV